MFSLIGRFHRHKSSSARFATSHHQESSSINRSAFLSGRILLNWQQATLLLYANTNIRGQNSVLTTPIQTCKQAIVVMSMIDDSGKDALLHMFTSQFPRFQFNI